VSVYWQWVDIVPECIEGYVVVSGAVSGRRCDVICSAVDIGV